MIDLVNVTKRFDGNTVLDNVSMKIEKGETYVIIGRSGTGKTVTLKHIAGLLEPDSGDILVEGDRINGVSNRMKDRVRNRMGMVFQSGALINWMNIRDNVGLPLVEHRLYPPEKIEEIVNERLHLLQIEDAAGKMPADISGGMKKRAGLARVLVRNPEIILYDEPTSGLDPVMSSLINSLIRRMQKEFNVTSVVVTHDMNSAYDIADRIAMLYDGKVIQCDTPDRIINTDNAIVRQFISGSLEGPIQI